MSARKIAACVAVAIICYASEAGADETSALRFRTPARCTTEGGSTVDLAPGRYLPEPTWTALDLEVRRLQDVETRLSAENAVLRQNAEPHRSTWILAGLALAAGIGVGVYASR